MFLGTLFVPSIYQPRRPRASPLWQIIHDGWHDYLIYHLHLHVLAADGLFTPAGRFHCMPVEQRRGVGGVLDGGEAEARRVSPLVERANQDLAPTIELFRHRFLQALRDAKLIGPSKLAKLLAWKHSGFNIHHGGEQPVPAHDAAGRKRLAAYLLRHPFLGGRSLGAEPECFDQPVRRSLLTAIAPRATAVGEGVSATWQPKEIPLDDGHILVLDH
jgi:hypothetical protein